MVKDDMPAERGFANAPPQYHKQRVEELKHEERRIGNTLAASQGYFAILMSRRI